MRRAFVSLCVVVVLLGLTVAIGLGARLQGTLSVSPSGIVRNGTRVTFTYTTEDLTKTQAAYVYTACHWSGPSAGYTSNVLEGPSPLTWSLDLPLSRNQKADCYAILTVSQE